MSTAIVFETAAIRFFLFSAYKSHPERESLTEIDYNTVRVVFPLFLVGSFLGVYLAIAVSDFVLTVLTIVVLGSLSLNSLWKSRQLYVKETAKLKQAEGDFTKAENNEAGAK